MRRTILALGLACLGGAAVRAEEPAEAPACVVPAFLSADDAGLWATYDGIRRGLEEASLPRVCRQPLPADDAAWTAALAPGRAAGAPLVFAVGARAIEACRRRAAATPFEARPLCVYVDVAVVEGPLSLPGPALDVPPPSAVVRAEVPLARWRELVRALLGPDRPAVSGPDLGAAGAATASRVEERLGVSRGSPARAVLDWRFDGGAHPAPPSPPALPVLSDDRGLFGRGVCAVVVPEHGRLGRLAAEAGRRLARGEGRDAPLRLTLPGGETWVDLEACDRAGLRPPLTFLASVDRLRRAPGPAGAAR